MMCLVPCVEKAVTVPFTEKDTYDTYVWTCISAWYTSHEAEHTTRCGVMQLYGCQILVPVVP